MVTAGIVVMAVMMGAMFLFGGHGKGHKHNKDAPPEAVSGGAVISTAAAQGAPAGEDAKDSAHTH
ncbi:MAG: hypothetical protein Q8O90_01020 [Elusimicrobiota bacterium]|nr:hypothetical protein [Elusimicrobiota bacterium]